MCDPMVVFSAISAVSGYMGKKQQSKTTKMIAANNAELQRRQSRDALRRGEIAEENSRRQTMIDKGSQQATMAANGVELGSGSAEDILQDTTQIGELDARTIRANAANESSYYNQSANNTLYAGNAQASSLESDATGSLLSGAGRVAEKWYTYANASGG